MGYNQIIKILIILHFGSSSQGIENLISFHLGHNTIINEGIENLKLNLSLNQKLIKNLPSLSLGYNNIIID